MATGATLGSELLAETDRQVVGGHRGGADHLAEVGHRPVEDDLHLAATDHHLAVDHHSVAVEEGMTASFVIRVNCLAF